MSSSAEQRREARRRKILGNPDERMKKIFGVEGKEREPGLEDGNPYRVPSSHSPTNVQEDGLLSSASRNNNNYSKSGREEVTGNSSTSIASDYPQDVKSPTYDEAFFRQGRKKWYQRRRIVAAALIGVLLRLLILTGAFSYVMLPWILYQIVIEVIHAKKFEHSLYPQHGHVVDILLYCGYAQDLAKLGGRVTDVVSRVVDDFVVFLLSFLLLHSLLSIAPSQ